MKTEKVNNPDGWAPQVMCNMQNTYTVSCNFSVSRHVLYNHLNAMVYIMVSTFFGFVVQSQDCHKIIDLKDSYVFRLQPVSLTMQGNYRAGKVQHRVCCVSNMVLCCQLVWTLSSNWQAVYKVSTLLSVTWTVSEIQKIKPNVFSASLPSSLLLCEVFQHCSKPPPPPSPQQKKGLSRFTFPEWPQGGRMVPWEGLPLSISYTNHSTPC